MKKEETFISKFIKPSLEKVSKFIDKEDFVNCSIDIHNLGIIIRNILENYDIECSEPEMLSYDNPFHVSLIINIPFVTIDIGFKKNEDDLIEYEIRIENQSTKIKRKYSTENFEFFEKYIIGYLSSYTQLYEILRKTKNMDLANNSID